MHALILHHINHYTKFEVSSFTNYKDMIWAKFLINGSHDSGHALLGMVSHRRL